MIAANVPGASEALRTDAPPVRYCCDAVRYRHVPVL